MPSTSASDRAASERRNAGAVERSIVAANLLRNEKLKANYDKRYGEDFVNKFIESADDAKKEAEGLRKTLEVDYRGVLEDDGSKEEPKGKLRIGAKAPETVCQDVNGSKVNLSDLSGKVVVLDFWATWCGPCRAMIPHERELVEKMKDKPFALVSVSCDAQKQTLQKFLEKEEMPWTHWFDGQHGSIGKKLNIRYYPTIYVLDAKGTIRYKGVRGEAMDKAVETLLKEVEPAAQK